MTPNNREELVKLMSGAVNDACYPPRTSSFDPVFVEVTPESIAKSILTALDTAGIDLMPRVATVEMEIAGTEQWLCEAAMEDRSAANYTAMLSASPFRKDGSQ